MVSHSLSPGCVCWVSLEADVTDALKDQSSESPSRMMLLAQNPNHLLIHLPCTWCGVSCTTDHNHRVNSIHLPGLGLSGTLSPHLSRNNFYGQIPIELGRLFLLTHFILAENSITGAIPASLSQCQNLRVISLGFNKLTGHLPPELGALPRLQVLDASGNNLTGVVPPTFGNLSALTVLSLDSNNLSGPPRRQSR
ncbi:unnamed protein product [Camellia sinensis]